MSGKNLEAEVKRYHKQALEMKEAKKYDEAIEYFRHAWKLADDIHFVEEMKAMIPNFMTSYYLSNRFDEGVVYHNEAIEFAIRENDIKLQARIYTGLSALLWFQRKFDESLTISLIAREKCEEANDNIMLLKTLTNLAITESSLDNIERSLEYYRELFTLAEEMNAPEELLIACLNLQALYFDSFDYDRSMDYGIKGLEIARKTGAKEEMSALINNIGNIHFRKSEYKEALKYYLEGIDLLDEKHTKRSWLANNYMNIGMSYVNLDRYDEGEVYLRKALEIADMYPRICQETRARVLANLSIVHVQRDELDEAEEILGEIIPKLDELDLGFNRTFFIQSFADVLEQQGKFKEAIKVYQIALEKTTQLYDDTLAKGIAQAQTMLEHESKVRETELLKKKNLELEIKNKELEEAQETIRELERRNTINAMAVTANHEMNQPLMIIRGNLDLLIDNCMVENHDNMKYIERISSAIERIEKLLLKYRTAERSTLSSYSDSTAMVTFDEENQ